MSVSALGRAIRRRRPSLVCVDCFDTLLLRGADHEEDRIRRLGVAAEAAFAAEGMRLPHGAVAATRRAAAHAVYRSAARTGIEGRHRQMLALQCIALGIDPAWALLLESVEIEQETRDLRANRPLADLLRDCRRQGVRVVAVSDMYLSSEAIRRLLEGAGVADCVDHVYASSDHGSSKRQGDLFRVVLTAEGVSPGDCLHAGDCHLADYEIPRSRGIAAVRIPRPIVTAVRSLRRLAARLRGTPAHA
jgi:FMN phosphatase YigB (HAD superfamily)